MTSITTSTTTSSTTTASIPISTSTSIMASFTTSTTTIPFTSTTVTASTITSASTVTSNTTTSTTTSASTVTSNTTTNTTTQSSNSICTATQPNIPNIAEEFYRGRNATLCQASMAFVLRCVLNWGCNKNENMIYKDYINDLHKNKFTDEQAEKLKQHKTLLDYTNCDTFDVTSLNILIRLIIDPNSTLSPVPPAASACTWDDLDELLRKFTIARNAFSHDVTTAAVSESYFMEYKPSVEKLLEKAAIYFGVTPDEKNKADNTLDKLLKIHELEINNDRLLEIRKKFWLNAKEEMKIKWTCFSKMKLPFCGDVEVAVESVYNPVILKQWKEASTDKVGINTANDFKAESVLDEWTKENYENIKLLCGDAGSGKTFLTKILFLSWLGLINLKFNKLMNFELLIYMQCRDDRQDSLKKLIKANYPNTCTNLNMDDVVEAFQLPGTRILYVVDGADERNQRSNALLMDILDQFPSNTKNTCLLTLRPHELESVKSLLNDKGLLYQGCIIKELSEARQIESLERLQKEIHKSRLCSLPSSATPLPNIVECFKNIQIKSVFCHPLNIVYFCDLCLKKPDEVATWTGEADVMHAMYNLYKQVSGQKIMNKKWSVPNFDIKINLAFEQLEQYSFKLFVNKKYALTKDEYYKLRLACFKNVSSEVDYEAVFSSVLLCEKDAQGRDTGIYNFPHLSVQEHLQAMAVVSSWEKEEEKTTIKETLDKMIQSCKKISGTGVLSSYSRYGKTIKYIILELLRVDHPRAEENIKILTDLLRLSGVDGFRYWATLVSGCRRHPLRPVVVQAAAVTVDVERWDEWYVGPGEVEAASDILAEMKLCKVSVPALFTVDIPRYVATPTSDALYTLFCTVGDFGGKMRLNLHLHHSRHHFKPCDALLSKLNSSPFLEGFIGCLREPGRVLAPLITPDSRLYLALMDPDHDLEKIRDKDVAVLEVSLKYPTTSASPPHPSSCSLPRALYNIMHLFDVPKKNWKWPLLCLTKLAPDNKKYYRVTLRNCGLPKKHLDKLRRGVVQEGVEVSSEKAIERFSAGQDVEGWSTNSWGTLRDRIDGSTVILL